MVFEYAGLADPPTDQTGTIQYPNWDHSSITISVYAATSPTCGWRPPPKPYPANSITPTTRSCRTRRSWNGSSMSKSQPPKPAVTPAWNASPTYPPPGGSTTSTSTPNPPSTASWSTSSPRCGSSKTPPTCCSSGRPVSARPCSPSPSATPSIDAGYRVYYSTAADLVARCHRAALEGRWATTMRFFAGPRLLIIDEAGLPAPGRRSRRRALPSHHQSYEDGIDRVDLQPRCRVMGQDLRRPHGRRRDARPAPTPLRRVHHQRRQLPHAHPPRSRRQTPQRNPPTPTRGGDHPALTNLQPSPPSPLTSGGFR